MLSVAEIILRIAIIMVGIALHALFPSNIITIIIGIILIICAPIGIYRHYEHRIYEDPSDVTTGEWRDFPEAKLKELLELIPHVSKVSKGGAGKYAIDAGAILTFCAISFVVIAKGGIIIFFLFDIPVILIIDLFILLFAIYRLFGGSLKAHPVSLQADALELFLGYKFPNGFTKKFQAHIVKDINGDPDILNVRMQIQPNNPISGLLCMMTTISRTDVQGVNYPFAYFVIVFGGKTLASQSSQFSNGLQKILIGSEYHLETNINDDNSVFVIVPNKPKYNTDSADCAILCEIIAQCCMLCESCRDEIEMYAVARNKR
jgi:hypothetical protein